MREQRRSRGPELNGKVWMRQADDDGFVLITVVGLLLIVAIIASTLLLAARTGTKARAAIDAAAELAALTDGVVRLTAWRLAQAGRDAPARVPVDGSAVACSDEATTVEVRVYDTAGLIDINEASTGVLVALLAGLGAGEAGARRLAAAIVDFRDSDDNAGPDGAEARDYQAAGRSIGPKNARFDSIDELDQVLGMMPELLERLRPLVTVHARSPALDIAVAPIELLQALSPGDLAERAAFRPPPQLPLRPSGRPSRDRLRFFAIRAIANRGDVRFARQAVVELTSRAPTGFIVRAWTATPEPRFLAAPPTGPCLPVR